MNKKISVNIAVAVVCVVIVGGLSFFGGIQYGKSSSAQTQNAFQQGQQGGFAQNGARTFGTGQPGARTGNRASGGFSSGEILSKDDKSITVKLVSGGSQIIFFSTSTPIMKSTSGTSADLIVGESVMATGPANQDGSINAQTIQIRPAGMPAIGNRPQQQQ